jgi:hypothetical protein
MTTHETQPEFLETAVPAEHAAPAGQSAPEQYDAPAGQSAPTEHSAPAGHSAPVEQPVQRHEPQSHDRPTDQTLFADGELSDLRSRWTEVQSQFVDDPRDCVQKADGLVSDVVERLTAGFAQARSGLEEQWSRGEQASTEDLRIALQRYRDFFERLLAV